MRMNSHRRSGFLLGLAVVLGVPSLASAQLFPNLPIRRQRPDCSQENPQFKVIRQEYWGYYPTCWRKFPAGSGCPSPEAPDWAKAIDKERGGLPLSKLEAPSSRKPETPPTNDRNGVDRQGEGVDRPGVRPRPEGDMPKTPDDAEDPFLIKPKKPAGADPKGTGDPFTDPPVNLPKVPGGTSPAPLGDPPATTAAPSRRGRGLVAGLFGRRN